MTPASLRRLAAAVGLWAGLAGDAAAQALPRDSLRGIVGRMEVAGLVDDSTGARLRAAIDAGRITLRSSLASEQHRARMRALTGVASEPMSPFGPMMVFDGRTGLSQADWLKRFVASGLVTPTDVALALGAYELRPVRAGGREAPPGALDSLLALRTPVPVFGDLLVGIVAARERQHPDRLGPWLDEIEAAGLLAPGARRRLLDSARVRLLLPADFAAAVAPRWVPSRVAAAVGFRSDSVSLAALAAEAVALHEWLIRRGDLVGPAASVRLDTTRRALSWDAGRDEIRGVLVLREGGRLYRSEPLRTIVQAGRPARYEGFASWTGVFNRMLRDREASVRLVELPDRSVLAASPAQVQALAEMQGEQREVERFLAALPDSVRARLEAAQASGRPGLDRDIDIPTPEAAHLLGPVVQVGLDLSEHAFRSARVDALVRALEDVGWFARTGWAPERLYEQTVLSDQLFEVLLDGAYLSMDGAEHGYETPYAGVIASLVELAQGGIGPTDVRDDFATTADSARGSVGWVQNGQRVRVTYEQGIGDSYDAEAVRAIVRALNTAARGGRFGYHRPYSAYVWLPEGSEPVLAAEGLTFERP